MITAIPEPEILALVKHQLNTLFGLDTEDKRLINVKWGGKTKA